MTSSNNHQNTSKIDLFPSLHPLGNYYREKHINEKRNLATSSMDPEPQLPTKKIHAGEEPQLSNFKKFERARNMPRNNDPILPPRDFDTSQVNKNAQLLVAMYEDDVKKTLNRVRNNEMASRQTEDKMKSNISFDFQRGLEFMKNALPNLLNQNNPNRNNNPPNPNPNLPTSNPSNNNSNTSPSHPNSNPFQNILGLNMGLNPTNLLQNLGLNFPNQSTNNNRMSTQTSSSFGQNKNQPKHTNLFQNNNNNAENINVKEEHDDNNRNAKVNMNIVDESMRNSSAFLGDQSTFEGDNTTNTINNNNNTTSNEENEKSFSLSQEVSKLNITSNASFLSNSLQESTMINNKDSSYFDCEDDDMKSVSSQGRNSKKLNRERAGGRWPVDTEKGKLFVEFVQELERMYDMPVNNFDKAADLLEQHNFCIEDALRTIQFDKSAYKSELNPTHRMNILQKNSPNRN